MPYEALVAGLAIALCFPLGSWLALNLDLNHRIVAVVMMLGAGLLIGALSLELVVEAMEDLGVARVVAVMLLAAGLFSGANAWLAARGAKHRNRCGECISQKSEEEHPSSGQAIALGTVMDALPEAIVVGVVVGSGGAVAPLATAIGCGNIAESLSSSAGMRDAGRSRRYIFGLWWIVAMLVVILAVLGAMLMEGFGSTAEPWIEAFAAGVLLAMVAEAMLPEAVHESPKLSGLLAALGFGGYMLLAYLL